MHLVAIVACVILNSGIFACAPGSCRGQNIIRVPSDCAQIQDAIACIPDATASVTRVSVLIAPGRYNETIRIPANKRVPISLLGLGMPDEVIVTAYQECGGANASDACGVLQVSIDDFVMSNITLWNEPYVFAGKTFTAEISGDRAAFYNCKMMGKDDVVFTGRKRVYFRDTWINGSTDFNFGQGSAVYDRCTLMAEPGRYWSFITAHAGNTSVLAPNRTAFLIQDSTLPYCGDGARNHTTFLGRPWGPLAAVVYKNCWMDGHIHPAGWTPGKVDVTNVFYAEFNSSGPGASPSTRAPFSQQLSSQKANDWTIPRVLQGWTPSTHATYPTRS